MDVSIIAASTSSGFTESTESDINCRLHAADLDDNDDVFIQRQISIDRKENKRRRHPLRKRILSDSNSDEFQQRCAEMHCMTLKSLIDLDGSNGIKKVRL